jgi:[ribosomal protein S5]-alanine N-acetyltransferase
MQHMSTMMNETTVYLSNLQQEVAHMESRISLKNLTSSDLSYFYVWASDSEVSKTMTWDAYTSQEDASNFLVQIVENHPWFKAICLDGIPVGSITLTQGKGVASCKAELGYVLAKAYWGKNITTIAVKQAITVGFSDLNIQRIEAFVDPDNIASQKVLVKAGMVCEGLLKNYTLFKGEVKDRYIYAITK